MKNIIKKTIFFLIISLVILLPVINSHFFDLVGIKFGRYVNGNYEFSKVIFFNILSGIIIILFYLKNINSKIIIPKTTYLFFLILILSSFFSKYQLTSLFGEAGKGHGILMFLNLLGLFIVFINLKKKELNNIVKYIILGSIITLIFGIKEYYFPTFNYGNLSNRAIGTFGHPNYLALYILVIIPLIINKISILNKTTKLGSLQIERKRKTKIVLPYILLILSIFILLLTKSIWGIFIIINYLLYIIYKFNKNKIHKNYIVILGGSLLLLIGYIIYSFGLLTKLNSFISRFYIFKTTINIILSDIKNIIVGLGADTMSYTFTNFKVPELYIFENFGYIADRPHNLLLYIFYHFGILGIIGFIYSIFRITKKQIKNSNIYYFHSTILFLIFTIFNFSSISVYIIIVLLSSIILKQKIKKSKSLYYLPFIFISFLSIFGSIIYYKEEVKTYSNKLYISENNYYNKIILENPEKKIFRENFTKENICKKLIGSSSSAENYLYCGDLFWNYDNNIATIYYKLGLKNIPNMWDQNSIWYKNYLIKKLFVPERFFSEKYSNLSEILKKVGK